MHVGLGRVEGLIVAKLYNRSKSSGGTGVDRGCNDRFTKFIVTVKMQKKQRDQGWQETKEVIVPG